MHPWLASKGARLAGSLLKSGFKFKGVDLKIDPKDYIDRANGTVYVFDDVERADMSADAVFGYLNQFVEHDGSKVIVVANEKELEKTEGYWIKREKLIGQTLEAASSTQEAFAVFLASMRDQSAKRCVEALQGDILALYEHAEVRNLRVLRQTIWDFERLFTALSENHRANAAAVRQVALEIFAFSFEVKLGRLAVDDLRGRMNAWVKSTLKNGEIRPIANSIDRYPSVNLVSTTLSDDALTSLLGDGVVDGGRIAADLDASSWFLTEGQEAAWRTVWNFLVRDGSAVQAAIVEMRAKIKTLDYTEPGEILHVFGLLLMLSRTKIIRQSATSIIAQGKSYVRRLQRADLLPGLPTDLLADDIRHDAWSGLVFFEHETPEFREIARFLHEQRQIAHEAGLPKLAEELLLEMSDPSKFAGRLVGHRGDGSQLIEGPVLSHVTPARFLAEWLARPPRVQREVITVLTARYSNGAFERGLEAERPWLISLIERMRSQAKRSDPVTRYRLVVFADNLAEKLNAARQASSSTTWTE